VDVPDGLPDVWVVVDDEHAGIRHGGEGCKKETRSIAQPRSYGDDAYKPACALFPLSRLRERAGVRARW
jgi:hypothetical protein